LFGWWFDMLVKTFKKLLFILTPHERERANLLLIMALLDIIGVALAREDRGERTTGGPIVAPAAVSGS
jgi:hypothetical protein